MRQRTAMRGLISGVALLLVTAACGGAGEDGGNGQANGGGTPQPEFTTVTEGVLTAGSCMDYPPFEFVEGGDEKGFDVDLTEAIAERLGLQVEWVRIDFDTIFTAVAAGQFDVAAAAITATGETGEERDQTVDFSDFYFDSEQSLAVNVQESGDVQTLTDLGSGDTIGVQKGTTGKDYAEANAPEGVQIRTYGSIGDAFLDLEAGNITAIVNDFPSSVGEIEQRQLEGTVEIVEQFPTEEKYAFAFSPDNPELLEAFNEALAEVIADGTYEEIFSQYFPGVEVPEAYQAA